MLLERMRIRHRIHDVPEATTSTTDGEVVRVTGVVRAIGPLLTSLLSGRPCVAYRTRMRSNPRKGGPPDHGESVVVARFAVERGADDHVVVEGSHALFDAADLDLPRDNDAREEHVRLLFALTGLRVMSRAEAIIEVGTTVTVAGLVMSEPADLGRGEHGFRDGPPQLRLVGDPDHPLLISQRD